MGDVPKHSIKESIGHEDRGTTVVTVLDDLTDYGEETAIPLAEIIDQLQAALDSIPEEFRASATLNISGTGEYVHVSAGVTFARPETDAELADRRRWLAGMVQEREDRDRREFQRLSQKYERS